MTLEDQIRKILGNDSKVSQYNLCRLTGRRAKDGWCPIHNSDSCLYLYVSYVDAVGELAAALRRGAIRPLAR